jgi:hypothetical protein
MIRMVGEKTLVDLAELFLEKKRAWNVDTTLKLTIGGTEIGAIAVKGKIEYAPSEERGKEA